MLTLPSGRPIEVRVRPGIYTPVDREGAAQTRETPWSTCVEHGAPGLVAMSLAAEVEALDAEEFGGLAEFFLDAEELVVLGDAVGAAGRAGLDLAGAGGDREVGDEGVFRLAGAVR